ncbi:trichohyalin-like isoform X2 [Mangifera indica]|uniref:trichohyalin-like isoform X2 n=1 Tax=Mangifera indica TaxID=29780 RepID=UPI001CF98CBE|nr:trichohyalin-like isoform X2 [Mangifera indica]
MAAELEVNGGEGEVSLSPKDLCNGHATNADSSYVFVNGNDVVSDGPVQTDLNSDSNSTVELELTNEQSKADNDNDEGEKIEASDVSDSLILVSKGDVVQENEQLKSRSGDHGFNVAVPPGELGPEAASGPVADFNLETLVVRDPATDETEHAEETVVVNDLVCDSQKTTVQLNNTSEIANGTPSDVPVSVNETTTESDADAPASISETRTEPPSVELGASTTDENLPSAETETEAPKLDMGISETPHSYPVNKTMVDNEVENSETVVVNDLVCDSQKTTVQLNNTSEIANGTPLDVPVSVNETTTEPDADAPASISETTTEPPSVELGASTTDENLPSAETETEAPKLDMGTSETSHSYPVNKTMVDNEVENGFVGADDLGPDTEIGIASIVSEEKASPLTSDGSDVKSKVLGVPQSIDSQTTPVDNATIESSISGSEEKESSLPTCPGADVMAGSEIGNVSAVSCAEMPIGDVSESEVLGGSVISSQVDEESSVSCSVETTCPGADMEAGSEIKNRLVVSCTDMPVANGVVSESENLDPEVLHVENGGTLSPVEEKGTGVEELEERGSEEIEFKTCQEVEEKGSEVVGKACQEAEEEIDDKTCQEEEKGSEEIDEKPCQEKEERGSDKSNDKTGEIQFASEGSDDTTHQEGLEIQELKELSGEEKVEIQEVEGLTGEDRDDNICQVGEENENVEIQFGHHGASQEEESIDGTHRDEILASTPEGSVTDASEMQNAGAEVVKRPFYFLVKVPRYDDENLREQIKSAQLKVDEKTQSRDVIRAEIQGIRDANKKYGDSIEVAVLEEKAARELLKSKRQEIDSLQVMINKVKNAISIEDIDGRIRNMEHKIAHESLPLKEEKQFIRDIKQLKQLREQFSSSMGKQDDVKQAFDQKDQIEERLKLLRKEADSLRQNVLKAEAATQAAKKKHKDESEKLKKLYAEFNVADEIRQEAYKHLQNLRKQAYTKNKHFWKYKDDVKQVNDLLSKGEKEELQHFCVNQVERVLELWNSNNEFRKEYVNSNIRSTLRRLKTLDGRTLGPDEEPPVFCPFVNNRVTKDNSVPQSSTAKEAKTEEIVLVESEKKDDKPLPIVGKQKSQMAKYKRPAKPAHSANGLARDEIEEERDEEPRRTKEEEELARKAEELRKEEEAARLKEQRRLEEKVKAKEALERKKRIAEKAQARAVLRAQKEAEQKEKEREKRARKKEKRKVAATDDSDLLNKGESAPSTEMPLEIPQSSETREKLVSVTKKPNKSAQFTKQSKTKSIPLPLRKRGKRRMQTWMWVVISALLVVALFLLGNDSFPSKFGLKQFGF